MTGLPVLSGGTLDVLSGGTVVSTELLGSENLLGIDRQEIVYSGGSQIVSSGGLTVGTTVQSGGTQTVSSGGMALGTTVQSSGSVIISGDGIVSGATVHGAATVLSGGTISNSFVGGSAQGASLIVSAGVAIGTTVSNAVMTVSGVTSTFVASELAADTTTVLATAAAIGTVIVSGSIEVGSGASTTGTVLSSGTSIYARAEEFVEGGTATGTLIGSGAEQTVDDGTTLDTVVSPGGLQYLTVDAVALNTAVFAGGTVSATGGILAYTEAAGATDSFAGTLLGSLTLVQSGPGTLALAGSLSTFSGTVLISGGTLELTSASAAGSATMICFAPGEAGALRIDGAGAPATAISGFVSGDTIDLAGVAFGGNVSAAVSGDLVTVREGGVIETLTISDAGDDSLSLSGDGAGGTALTNARAVAVVASGQTLTIGSGQTSTSVAVLSGGTLVVQSGGTVVSASIAGTEVLSGGVDSLGTVSSGGLLTVSSGGVASGTVVLGSAVVLAGGMAIGDTVSSGGFTQGLILSGGTGVATTVFRGGTLTVQSAAASFAGPAQAGNASFTTVSGGSIQDDPGGNTTGTVLLVGAIEYVSSGATATGTMVSAGGLQQLYGGTAVDTILAKNGDLVIASGTAVNPSTGIYSVVFDNGLVEYNEAAGVTSSFSATLQGAGELVQFGPGTLVLAGSLGAMGTLEPLSTFSGMAVISGGTLDVTSIGTGGAAIDFATTSGELRIDHASGPGNTISGFAAGDLIDLAGLAYAGTTTPQTSGNTVTVKEGGLTETLLLAGASFRTFRLSADSTGGTELQVACYTPGTRILTARGEVAVADLAIGDRVITLSGAAEPVRWIGRRSYAGRFLAGKQHLLPVCIRAGALGGGLPWRDLSVSPNHAMFLDGVLIPAGCLVNGLSITQQRHCPRVDYIHIELAQHDIILAEGAPSETFLDDDSRGMFHNLADYEALYSDVQPPGRFYAPRVTDGYQLEAIRRRLAEAADEMVVAA